MNVPFRQLLAGAMILFVLPSLSLSQDAERKPTLQDLREKYLGQRVVITGGLGFAGRISQWSRAREKAPGEFEGYLEAYIRGEAPYDDGNFNLPGSYNGQEAIVLAVQPHDKRDDSRRQDRDVFGDPVGASETPNPTVTLVVRFDDGTLAILTPLPAELVDCCATPLSVRDRRKQLVEQELAGVIGRKLYATAGYYLYEPDTTVEELLGYTGKRLENIPLLQALTIEKARYLENHNRVLLKLALPDGRDALFSSIYRDEGVLPVYKRVGIIPPNSDSFLARVASPFLTAIPDTLTQEEVEAVQKGRIFTGMKREAIFYLLGYPEKQDDYGLGGKQWVYDSGKLTVYLDREGTVTNFQRLE